jgi:hypothetical protein
VNASSVVSCVSALALVQELLAIEMTGLHAHVSQRLDDGIALTTQHQQQRQLLVDDMSHTHGRRAAMDEAMNQSIQQSRTKCV